MDFTYTAKSRNSQTVTGIVTAEAEGIARRQLRDQGLFVMEIARRGHGSARVAPPRLGRSRVRRYELLAFTTQLAIMTRAGIDTASALQCIRQNSRNAALKTVLTDVVTAVEGGQPLSDALRSHPAVFDETYTASLAAGEKSGQLPNVLHHLMQLLKSELARRAALRGLVAYPILLICISSIVMLALVCFVLPEFARVFQEMNMTLPAITNVLLGGASWLRSYALVWLPLVATLGVAIVLFWRSNPGRRCFDHLAVNVAVLREVTRALLVGRTFRLLGMLLESGVTALEGVQLVGRSVRNVAFRELFRKMEQDLLSGRPLSYSLAEIDILPPETKEMVHTAERTGTLAMVTLMMGEHYEEQGEGKLRDLVTLLEPIIVIGMGFFVGVIILSVMLPMFDIATMAGG